ncbi:uncharacterized protein LOC101448447 [Ceratitis capitata]|uniref:uncharacterized protein LOC101448447 n=1 Tax=Ceratitis capitata TaxID=7213 RepID=UPI0006188E71|nr:uncharacterized protein LOC101448447 [Ceratitis capitata]
MSVRITPPILTKSTEAAEEETPERAELPYNFEKELIENQNRHFCGHKTFVPCTIVEPLEMKFHAKHDLNTLDYEKYLPFVEQRGKRRARGILPHLSAEVYGWLPVNLVAEGVKELNFICAPKIRSDMTIHGERVVSERVTERPPFNGLRFVV